MKTEFFVGTKGAWREYCHHHRLNPCQRPVLVQHGEIGSMLGGIEGHLILLGRGWELITLHGAAAWEVVASRNTVAEIRYDLRYDTTEAHS